MSPFSYPERLVTASLGAFLIAGCSSTPPDPEVSFVGKAAVAEASEDKLTSLIQGTLRDTGQCLILSAEGGGEYLPVFPKGDIVEGDASNGYMLRGAPLSSGAVVSFGGGELTPPSDTNFGRAASRCGVSKIWLVS